MERRQLDPLQWKNLVNSILDERCILLLGPMMAVMREVYFEEGEEKNISLAVGERNTQAWKPIYEQLALHLAKTVLQVNNVKYDINYQSDLEYISQRYLDMKQLDESDLQFEANQFIERHTNAEVPPVYCQLAGLPVRFPLIINTFPDTYLHRAFADNVRFAWYNFNGGEAPDIREISKNNPLVYNLVGRIGERNSLILTEAQQITFVKKVLKKSPEIPPKVLSRVSGYKDVKSQQEGQAKQEKMTYLFLGFNFERWQFRMLLDGLNLPDDPKTYSPRYPLVPELQRRTAEFYASRFKFTFVEDQVEGFVRQLHQKLEEANQADAQNGNTGVRRQLYLSFHDNEQPFVTKLEKQLKLLEQNKRIKIWHRGMNDGGQLQHQIQTQLERSQYIVPLISADYMAAAEGETSTIERIFAQNIVADAPGGQVGREVIPVLARAYPWEDSEFGRLTIMPKENKPLEDPSWGGDYAFKVIYDELNDIIQ